MMINEFCGAHGFSIIPLRFFISPYYTTHTVDFLFQADIKVGTLSAPPGFKGTDGARMHPPFVPLIAEIKTYMIGPEFAIPFI